MVGMGLVLPAILIVLFSTFTTTFLDIYSSAVSSLNIWPQFGERRASLICGVLGTALALVFPATGYEGFLLFIGSVFCPLFGVVLADYFMLRKATYFKEDFTHRDRFWYVKGFNPSAFFAWGAGFAIYHLLQKAAAIGSSIPSLVASGLLYLILMQLFETTATPSRSTIVEDYKDAGSRAGIR
jgi:purine-cytosine permease-like protein